MKFIKTLAFTLGIFFCFSGITFAANSVPQIEYNTYEKLIVNGETLDLENPPFSINGKRMLPLRSICEKLGYNISWNEKTRQVKIERGSDEVVLTIDDNTISVNNELKKVYFPPKIVNNRTYVIPAVIEVGLHDTTYTDTNDTFTILPRYKTTDGVNFIRKTVYKENPAGFVVGVAEVCASVVDNPDNQEGINVVNAFCKNYFDSFPLNEIQNELKELQSQDSIYTTYSDCNIVANTKNILSVTYTTPHGGSFSNQILEGKMFYKSTGAEVKISEIFNKNIHDIFVEAYKNNDVVLLQGLKKLKSLTESFYETPVEDTQLLKSIADNIENSQNSEVHAWISSENDKTLLTFRYYDLAGYIFISLDLGALDPSNIAFIV
ncbi:MAG: copper amine oxidase N-terminal domain-containing protein [Clostridiales bacterium]|nr:copper amine oxidase N-terminal domain-containing protein [Clostridiales bacterium]